MRTIAFFNPRGGVGKTTLGYHVAWMMSVLGVRTLVADLDPQADLTSIFLQENETERLWSSNENTLSTALRSLNAEIGDIDFTNSVAINEKLNIIPGDLSLSEFEGQFAEAWARSLAGDEYALNATTGFHQVICGVGKKVAAELAILDLGSNLGAINRAALIAADFVLIPLAADSSSLRGLEIGGLALDAWRSGWHDRVRQAPDGLRSVLPNGEMLPLGYVVSRHSTLAGMPPLAVEKWLNRIPAAYCSSVMNNDSRPQYSIDDDPYRLATLKDYRSLTSMAREARKPMFLLKPADGAIGGHQSAVADCRADFEILARLLLEKMNLGVK